jgi:hypothetical protein
MVIKKSPHWEWNPHRPQRRQTRYQLNSSSETCDETVKKVESKILCYKETVEWQEVRGESTATLQNRSRIGGFQSAGFPC